MSDQGEATPDEAVTPPQFSFQLTYEGSEDLGQVIADQATSRGATVVVEPDVGGGRSRLHIEVFYEPAATATSAAGSLTEALDVMEAVHTQALKLGLRPISSEPTDLAAQRRARIRPRQDPPSAMKRPS